MNQVKVALQKMLKRNDEGKNEFDKIEYMIKSTWGTSLNKRLVDRKKALQMFKHDYDFIKLVEKEGFEKVSVIPIMQALESPEVMRDLITFMMMEEPKEANGD